jgi:tripartite-type tricarboxylate transporter receptor subunit TctC
LNESKHVLKRARNAFSQCLYLIFLLFSMVSKAHAAYPDHPIRIVIPNAPGGGTDAFGRIIGQKLSEALHQSVIIENKPGAQGGIGTAFGAKAAPDGYTLTVALVSTMAVNPYVYKDIGYDPLKDFVAVAVGVNQPYLMVTYPDAPYNNLKELAAFAKSKANGATYSSTSSQTELIGVLFQSLIQAKMLYIPYKNASTAVVELARGDIDVMVASLPSAIPLLNAGKLKALAVTGDKRAAALPNVPSATESGYPEFNAGGWYGIIAPARTPAEIVTKLNQQINLILDMPDVQQSLVSAGFEVIKGQPEDFAAMIQTENQRWKKVVELNTKPK